jgi:branched-chain amino acid transport system substrate-binding protein
VVALVGWECGSRESTAAIGYTVSGGTGVPRVLEAVIDSTHRAGWPRITLARRLRPEVSDTESYLIQAVDHAIELAGRPDVVGVVGPAGSQDAMLVGPLYRDAALAFVMPTANAPQLATLGPTAFRLAPGVEEEAEFIAEFAAGPLRAGAVTVLYEPGSWGIALQAAVTAELWRRGVRVLGRFPVPIPNAELPRRRFDHVAQSALKVGHPDVVVLATHDDESLCLAREIAALDRKLSFIAGDGTVVSPPLVRDLGALRDRFHAVTFWNPSSAPPEAAAFSRLFEELTGSPPTYADAATFDAAMVLVAAVREVGADRRAVARYLAELGRRRPAFHGVTGSIAFQERRDGRLYMQAAGTAARPAAGAQRPCR